MADTQERSVVALFLSLLSFLLLFVLIAAFLASFRAKNDSWSVDRVVLGIVIVIFIYYVGLLFFDKASL